MEKEGKEAEGVNRGEWGQEISCVTGCGTCSWDGASLVTKPTASGTFLRHKALHKALAEGQKDKTEAPLRYTLELQCYFIIAKYLLRAKHPPSSQKDRHLPDAPLMSQDIRGEWA